MPFDFDEKYGFCSGSFLSLFCAIYLGNGDMKNLDHLYCDMVMVKIISANWFGIIQFSNKRFSELESFCHKV